MTRKRGKSRYSNPTKRTQRYRKKYTVDAVTKRHKKLLPMEYAGLSEALIDWNALEVLMFTQFAQLGIPTEEYGFYMSFAKRKAEIGLMFDETTRQKEVDILVGEFETRGLDKDKLLDLEPHIDEWIDIVRGKITLIFKEHAYEKEDETSYAVTNLTAWKAKFKVLSCLKMGSPLFDLGGNSFLSMWAGRCHLLAEIKTEDNEAYARVIITLGTLERSVGDEEELNDTQTPEDLADGLIDILDTGLLSSTDWYVGEDSDVTFHVSQKAVSKTDEIFITVWLGDVNESANPKSFTNLFRNIREHDLTGAYAFG